MLLTVRLDEELEALLTRVARERKVRKSELVRAALRDYLSRSEEGREPTPFERIADLVGSVEGPPDLSRNMSRYVEERLGKGG